MTRTTDNPILTIALRWGAIFTVALAVIATAIGFFVAGLPGVWSALLGAGLAFIFLGLTAASMIAAQRLTGNDINNPMYFGLIGGVFMLKLVVFFVFMLWLRSQDWIDPWVFFVTVIAAVLGSLTIDSYAFLRARVPYVDVALPGDDNTSAK